MKYQVAITKKAQKNLNKLPELIKEKFVRLAEDLEELGSCSIKLAKLQQAE